MDKWIPCSAHEIDIANVFGFHRYRVNCDRGCPSSNWSVPVGVGIMDTFEVFLVLIHTNLLVVFSGAQKLVVLSNF